MRVCIAEKPSVAGEIAKILGASSRRDGYYEGNGFQVTWTSPLAPPYLTMYITTHNSISKVIKMVADMLPYGPSHRKLKIVKIGKGEPSSRDFAPLPT